jgi:O-succinylbenzoic acid--CoA ligase
MTLREVWLDGGPATVAELSAALADALDGGPAVLPLDAHHPTLADFRAAMAPGEPVEPNTAVIIATSGSTGAPKGVLLSAAALRASANATHARLGGPGHWLLATPTQFIGGLQVLVRARLAGTPVAVLPGGPFRPEPFADAAADVLAADGPRYTALVPTQLGRLLDAGGRGLAALRAFDAVIIGATAMPVALASRARDAGVAVVGAYGMSETASGCVYDGRPLDGVTVRIADAGAAGVGRIVIAGPVLANGYRLDPGLSAQTFTGNGYHTGDAGRLDADGRLDVLGRTDDVINTGGVKVPPILVERAIAAQPGVREVCVVALPDATWGQAVAAAVVPVDPAHPPDRDQLADAVRGAVGRAAVPKHLGFVDQLPLRGPGKVDRAAVAALLLK